MDKIALIIAVITGCFLFYLYVGGSKFIHNFFYNRFSIETAQLSNVIFNRFLGAFVFAIVPLLFQILIIANGEIKLGLHVQFNLISLWIVLSVGLLIVLMNYFGAKSPGNLKVYPQIRKKIWPRQLIWASAITWMLYLLGYEIMLRGFLFFNCVKFAGIIPALIINVCIYALLHLTKGMKETLGAIPMGIIFCIITFYTGTIWAAFWIHCTLALSNEWLSLKFHPEIKIEK